MTRDEVLKMSNVLLYAPKRLWAFSCMVSVALPDLILGTLVRGAYFPRFAVKCIPSSLAVRTRIFFLVNNTVLSENSTPFTSFRQRPLHMQSTSPNHRPSDKAFFVLWTGILVAFVQISPPLSENSSWWKDSAPHMRKFSPLRRATFFLPSIGDWVFALYRFLRSATVLPFVVYSDTHIDTRSAKRWFIFWVNHLVFNEVNFVYVSDTAASRTHSRRRLETLKNIRSIRKLCGKLFGTKRCVLNIWYHEYRICLPTKRDVLTQHSCWMSVCLLNCADTSRVVQMESRRAVAVGVHYDWIFVPLWKRKCSYDKWWIKHLIAHWSIFPFLSLGVAVGLQSSCSNSHVVPTKWSSSHCAGYRRYWHGRMWERIVALDFHIENILLTSTLCKFYLVRYWCNQCSLFNQLILMRSISDSCDMHFPLDFELRDSFKRTAWCCMLQWLSIEHVMGFSPFIVNPIGHANKVRYSQWMQLPPQSSITPQYCCWKVTEANLRQKHIISKSSLHNARIVV